VTFKTQNTKYFIEHDIPFNMIQIQLVIFNLYLDKSRNRYD